MKDFLQEITEETFGIKDILKPQLIYQPKNNNDSSNINLEETDLQSLDDLKTQVSNCIRCKLSSTRKNTVFGEGNPNAELMFIGEGPGEEEDNTGLPFVGAAGQLLTKMIEAMKLDRSKVYIANIIKCRPPQNRNPDNIEAETCIGYLLAQIKAVNPKYIVCLGSVASKFLFKEDIKITKERGHWRNFNGIKVMPTYHPSFLLRSPERKKGTWHDLQLVMKEMNLI